MTDENNTTDPTPVKIGGGTGGSWTGGDTPVPTEGNIISKIIEIFKKATPYIAWFSVFVIVIGSYFSFDSDIEYAKSNINKNDKNIASIKDKQNENEKHIAVIRTDIDNQGNDIAEIKDNISNINSNIKSLEIEKARNEGRQEIINKKGNKK